MRGQGGGSLLFPDEIFAGRVSMREVHCRGARPPHRSHDSRLSLRGRVTAVGVSTHSPVYVQPLITIGFSYWDELSMSEKLDNGTHRSIWHLSTEGLLRSQWIAAFLVSLWWGLAGGRVAASDNEPLVLRALTYNIHHAEDTNGQLDLERIAAVIRESKADVIALQEVDRNVPRSGRVDQLAELAKALNMHGVLGPNIDLAGGKYGNAILSRWPIIRWKNHLLPNVRSGEQRGLLEADIQLPGDRPLKLFATHFDHRPNEEERLQSAAFVNRRQVDRAKREASFSVILAGDINARPESETLQVLLQRWQMTDQTLAPTIPSAEPKHKIDYIFIERNTPKIKVLESVVVDEPVASDHRPLLSILEIQ